ncbi:uncharacterized protein LOC114432624 isoform X2 [Parambassis ranga]|uniref:Uncharacterized protein LOC114432624 isoform X2 n=1 Tax=Parambassis ranga TaxID=210632 RepID=A0A6P7I865_9TELE|nr:uncharacterized protein LOC114432624 isoform X2 [Parambassis ranga]
MIRCSEHSESATQDKARMLGEMVLEESQLSHSVPGVVWKILFQMKQDEIAFVIQNDYHLLQLAQSLNEKYRNKTKKQDYIRQRLREMGRLLLALYQKSVFSFEEAIKPRNFYKVVETLKDIAGFNKENQSYKNPSLALKLGRSLRKLVNIILSGTDNNKNIVDNAKQFIKQCEEEWPGLVSQTAVASLSGRKVTSLSTIPFTQDVQAFYKYLEKAAASATESVKMYDSPETYNALCRVTLAQVSVLNKCAPEVSKMTLDSFQERDDSTKVLSKHFIRINIQSKTSQNVTVLLTSELVSALMLLVSKRQACGVHADNPFLFAKPDSSSKSLYNGGNCIRAFSSHTKNPEHLRSVHLHKHMARIFQILNLENDELDHLAKLLGHNIRADRDYYRLPEAAVELAKIAKLILAMEKGSLERFKGNSLEEIEIEDELEPDFELGNTDQPQHSDEDDDEEEEEEEEEEEQQGQQLTPEQDALEHIKTCRDKPFLKAAFIDSFKGRGVFTHVAIQPAAFVLEYRGNILPLKETRKKKDGDTLNSYLFDFSWNGTSWRIDASTDDGTLGRLVNDNHISPNCRVEKIEYEGTPHLCLFALKSILPGEEITYDYGDSSYPWRSKETSQEPDSAVAASSSVDQQAEELAEAFSSAESLSDDEFVCKDKASSDESSASSNDENTENDPDAPKSPTQLAGASFVQSQDSAHHSSDDSDLDKNYSCTKKHFCYVCGKPYIKISRHLFTHRNEVDEIAQVYKLPRNSKKRRKILDTLRNRGNNKHNQEVLRIRSGKLKVNKMTSDTTGLKTFATCIYCKGMYTRKVIWRHLKTCPSMTSKPPAGVRIQILVLVSTVLTDPHHISSGVRKMLKKLKKDEIGLLIWEDVYILQLAQCLYYMSKEKKRDAEINQTLRQVGRLLLTLKKESVCSFEEATKPQNFSVLVKAMREFLGFREETKSYDRPRLRQLLGSSLKKIANINYARAVWRDADKETIEEAETFMKLCVEEWPSIRPAKPGISSTPTIPFIQDVQLLYQCMENTMESLCHNLTLYPIPLVYTALLRVAVAYVAILNKNAAEAVEVTLQSFKERAETELHGDAPVGQANLGQILLKNMLKINVKSIGGRAVSLILTPGLLSAITLLVTKRETCEVHEQNPYLFGRAVASCTSFYRSPTCINMFVSRCGAKNKPSLRSSAFRKHMARIFKFFSLTNSDLIELAKLLGRNIRTEREFYQTPEAAADIAKISEMLSAVESGCFKRFQEKSLEEIEIPDEWQPDVKQDTPEISDAEEEKKAGSSFQSGGFSFTKGCFANKNRVSATKKRSKSKKQKSQSDRAELNNDKNDDEEVEEEDVSVQQAGNTPEETPPQSKQSNPIYFSDDDEDMNVDFNIDADTDDDVRNEENNEDDGPDDGEDETEEGQNSSDREKKDTSADGDRDDNMDVDPDEEQNDLMEEDSDAPPAPVNTVLAGMKELKIVIPKLDITKLQDSVRCRLSSPPESKSQPLKEQPVHDDKIQSEPASEPASEVTNEPSPAQAFEMTCSHCKKNMMKGHTAYQKKGFKDVFCSKNCLFEMFLPKPATKTCHQCQRAISQPQDLIMASVDSKGTMKDFCGVACLCSFKCYTAPAPPPVAVCTTCNKSCTTTCEASLNNTVHKFCSDTCLDSFFRDKMGVCENCSSTCRQRPLRLKLGDETKTICSTDCLQEFKENIKTSHQCFMCLASRPGSDMASYQITEDTVELFCNRYCVSSYKLRPPIPYKIHDESSAQSNKTDEQSELTTVDANAPSTAKENDAAPAAEPSTTSPPISAENAKTCYSCLQVIVRPQSIILAPVDDSGNIRELCSNACLSSIQSKITATPPTGRKWSKCKLCSTCSYSKHKLTQDAVVHWFCSDPCFISYHKINNLTLLMCVVCRTFCFEKHLALKLEDGWKIICGDQCLVKFKENIKTHQPCMMCQTQHRMSDMVEDKNEESRLDFFCSNRCMMVYKSQPVPVIGKSIPSSEESDVKEVKPSLPNLKCIKEEPMDEEFNQHLPASVSPQAIKDEPHVAKVELQIDSAFSLMEDCKPAEPALTQTVLTPSCSHCKKVFMDGASVYQRKAHNDLFCSTPCLLNFYQVKAVKKTCHFCLQVINQTQDVLQAPVDNAGTQRDFCSQTCLSSFNYKSIVSTKIPLMTVTPQSQCSICSRHCISKHEIILQDVIHKICSQPCLLRFCSMNSISICENCHSHCSTPLKFKMEDGNKTLCGAECLAQFKQKIQTPQLCAMASKIQAGNASGASLNCDNCGKTTVPAIQLAMPNASIRNFCSLTCAMAFKEDQKDMTAASDQTRSDAHKPPEELLCQHCQQIITTTPRVIQNKENFYCTCSLTCAHEFKRLNNIVGMCEFCKHERIVTYIQRINNKDCFFCSDGCKRIFCRELAEEWGEECRSCAYCLSISRTVVMAPSDGVDKVFCSKDCRSKYRMLNSHMAKCDACGSKGNLKQSLPLVGEVKHFCDWKCLLRFCNNKDRPVETAPGSAATAESSPVITNVTSLASALSRHSSASAKSAKLGSVTDIQAKVVGHASVQTVSKELKNKSMLCAPLVHNKGISCVAQMVETAAQTEKSKPQVIAVPVPIPVPVPVYVPLPLNMYSQYTPTPAALPLPLPVPVFLPVKSSCSDSVTKTLKADLKVRPEREEEQEDRDTTKEEGRQDILSVNDQTIDKNQDSSFSDTSNPRPELRPPLSLETSLQSPSPAPPLLEGTLGKVHNQSKVYKQQKSKKETSRRTPRKHHKLSPESGVEAWRRWVQWRESQTSLSSHAVSLPLDIRHCSAGELSEGLCHFVSEVKQPNGEPYRPDHLFYLCLSIQQYLFENRRLENIFSDPIYTGFSTKLTRTLKYFRPLLHSSCVQEELLWDCKQLGAYSPIVLLNTLLFFCCKYFSFTSVEQHRRLSFAHFMRCTKINPDSTKTTFLRFYRTTSVNQTESDEEGVSAKKSKREEDFLEMKENPENPLRCPVRLYEFYLSKCSESVRQRTDLFYLQPDGSCVPSSPLWFSLSPLDDATMEAMIVRILAIQELQEEAYRQQGALPVLTRTSYC